MNRPARYLLCLALIGCAWLVSAFVPPAAVAQEACPFLSCDGLIDENLPVDVVGRPAFVPLLIIVDPSPDQLLAAALDSDSDGLSDWQEETASLTDPADLDSDDDGVADGAEIGAGSDPWNPASLPTQAVAVTGSPAEVEPVGAGR
jgi:hypothetical protein